MVASSCERKEPSTATVVIFQTNGSRPLDSLEDLGKGGQDLLGGADARETREDMLKGKAQAGTLTRGGLDACIGGDASEDDRANAAGFKLLLEVSSREGAPVPL